MVPLWPSSIWGGGGVEGRGSTRVPGKGSECTFQWQERKNDRYILPSS